MQNIKKFSGLTILILLILIKIQDSNFVKRIENISYDAFQSIFIEKSTFEDVSLLILMKRVLVKLVSFLGEEMFLQNLLIN